MFATPQQWFDAERTVVAVREAVIAKIREMSVNPKMTEALIGWIMQQPCEPMNSVCGFEIPDADHMKAEVKVIAGAWIAAGRPGMMEVSKCAQQ